MEDQTTLRSIESIANKSLAKQKKELYMHEQSIVDMSLLRSYHAGIRDTIGDHSTILDDFNDSIIAVEEAVKEMNAEQDPVKVGIRAKAKEEAAKALALRNKVISEHDYLNTTITIKHDNKDSQHKTIELRGIKVTPEFLNKGAMGAVYKGLVNTEHLNRASWAWILRGITAWTHANNNAKEAKEIGKYLKDGYRQADEAYLANYQNDFIKTPKEDLESAVREYWEQNELFPKDIKEIPVAVKISTASLASNQRQSRELRTQGLVGKNIVHTLASGYVHSTGKDKDIHAYLVQEFVEGMLSKKELKTLTPKEWLMVSLQILDGIEQMQHYGVLHRDLKPDNIGIRKPNGKFNVKLLDLGLVGFIDNSAESYQTMAGDVFGTPLYMSPEQASMQTALDVKSDLYSLGAILYTVMTGNHVHHNLPKDKQNPKEIVRNAVIGEPNYRPSLPTIKDAQADAITALLAKGLQRNPDNRYNLQEMKEDIVAILSGNKPKYAIASIENSDDGRAYLEGAFAPSASLSMYAGQHKKGFFRRLLGR